MGLDPAVARAGQRRVGAAAAVGEDRMAAALRLVLLDGYDIEVPAEDVRRELDRLIV